MSAAEQGGAPPAVRSASVVAALVPLVPRKRYKLAGGRPDMGNTNGAVKGALDYIDQHCGALQPDLVHLSRIPSISAEGFPPAEVKRSAQATAEVMRKWGVENVEGLEIEGVHPYVYGDWMHKAGTPTILLYGHHDVQPPGREARWGSLAFEPSA